MVGMVFAKWPVLDGTIHRPSIGLYPRNLFDDPIEVSRARAADATIRFEATASNETRKDYMDEPQPAEEILAEPSPNRGTGCRSRRD